MQRPRGLVTPLIQEEKNLRGNLSASILTTWPRSLSGGHEALRQRLGIPSMQLLYSSVLDVTYGYKSKSKSKCYPSYRIWAGAFRPSRRSVAAGQQPVSSFDWSWDSHPL